MINTKSFLVFLATILVALQAHGQVGSKTQYWNWTDYKSVHDAVVLIDAGGGTGTGVLVNIDLSKEVHGGHLGHVLTAYHVVKDEPNIKVYYRNCETNAKKCKIVEYDEKNDVALIWVWIPKKIQPIVIAEEHAKALDKLEFIGLGGNTDINGRLRSFTANASEASNPDKLMSDTFLIPGDSGGPILNSNSQLVGINSGGWYWLDSKYIPEENLRITWPARAGGVGPIRRLLQKIKPEFKSLAKN